MPNRHVSVFIAHKNLRLVSNSRPKVPILIEPALFEETIVAKCSTRNLTNNTNTSMFEGSGKFETIDRSTGF